MRDDQEVCLCFHVTKRKIVNYLKREDPPVASLISECLGAGTGCGWCIPFLKQLHAQQQAGELPDLAIDPNHYATQRLEFHRTGQRPEESRG
jgi:NAD(P)H-nitrite reductase large subunit